MKKFLVLFILFFVYIENKSYAILAFEDAAFPEFVTSARALAMGNAFICKVDDPWALSTILQDWELFENLLFISPICT